MENIIVSYQKNWDSDGFCTTQNITLSEDLMLQFNQYLTEIRKPLLEKNCYSSEEMQMLCYGMDTEKNQKRCLTLTQLRLLYQFLKDQQINCSRLKTDRNTMLIIKGDTK